jgi:hypothetical protein
MAKITIIVLELTRYNSQAIRLIVVGDSLVLDAGADIEIAVGDEQALRDLAADINQARADGYNGSEEITVGEIRALVEGAAPNAAEWDWGCGYLD